MERGPTAAFSVRGVAWVTVNCSIAVLCTALGAELTDAGA